MHNLNSMLESKHETAAQSESDSDDSLSLSDSEDDGQGETEEQRCEEMEELMRQMDQELASSSIGQSFQQVKSEVQCTYACIFGYKVHDYAIYPICNVSPV